LEAKNSKDVIISDVIVESVKALQDASVLLYPTDTIWGLGCDIFAQNAIDQIYNIKRRPRNKPMILLVDSIEMMKDYLSDLHPRVETLLTFHDKPLTLIGKPTNRVPKYLLGEEQMLAIRRVEDEFCRAVVRSFGFPIISTSANISNEPFPGNFSEISQEIKDAVDYIVPIRQQETQSLTPSVLAKYDYNGNLKFIRT